MNLEAEFLAKYEACISRKSVLLAISGGADSVALLRLLAAAGEKVPFRLFAAHMEHGIRAEASLRDMRFCEALCESFHIPLEIQRVNVPEEARKCGEGEETCARRLRHAFLREAAETVNADFIALAHHADDQAETVLMHLFRGSGMNGLCGMKIFDGKMFRPLLEFTHKQLTDYLEEIGQSWCEDETNLLPENPRNFLRLNVLPRAKEIFPSLANAVARETRVLQAENEYLRKAAEQCFAQNAKRVCGVWVLKNTENWETALLRRSLHELLPFTDFEAVQRALESESITQLSGGWLAQNYQKSLYLWQKANQPEPVPITGSGTYRFANAGTLTAAPCQEILRENGFAQTVAAASLKNACLRARRNGDYIFPFGMRGKRKSFSDYLTDKKFPPPLRDVWPVLARGREILWAPTLGISENAAVQNEESAMRLQINLFE